MEGMKWVMDHSEEVKSAQIRMGEAIKEHDDVLVAFLELANQIVLAEEAQEGTIPTDIIENASRLLGITD